MKIQKVFSSYDGYEEERIYSVLMNEEELSLFSEIQKEFGKVKQANKLLKKERELRQAFNARNSVLSQTGKDLTPDQAKRLVRLQNLVDTHAGSAMHTKKLDEYGNLFYAKRPKGLIGETTVNEMINSRALRRSGGEKNAFTRADFQPYNESRKMVDHDLAPKYNQQRWEKIRKGTTK